MLRGILRRLRAEAQGLSGASARARERLDGTHAVVLAYHRVMPVERATALAVEPGMFVTPQTFERHLDILAAEYRPLSLSEIVTSLEADRTLPRGACAITFDDGWLDNHEFALPALRRRGIPATVFVVTERIGTCGPFWPDVVARTLFGTSADRIEALAARIPELSIDSRDTVLEQLKAMEEERRADLVAEIEACGREAGALAGLSERELVDWHELREMQEGGFEVEAHGLTHTILSTVPPKIAECEIRDSGAALRERGFGVARLFAYPSGVHDTSICESVRQAGYRAAVTTEPGLVSAGLDRMCWPRIGIHEDVSRSAAEFLERVPGSAFS